MERPASASPEKSRLAKQNPIEQRIPRVSFGVPVFNAERHLAAALDSLLAQTFDDFEIVLCDNASTDSTPEICAGYASRDARIHFHRSSENRGAAANFNRCFELATGEYFKWAAHDDLCEPTFLQRCVEALDANPDCVLAYPRTRVIDDEGRPEEDYDFKLPTDSARPASRFNSLLRGHRCYEVFGLIRAAALKTTPAMGNYSHGDGVLLGRLALLGRFVEIPEHLFLARRHAQQSMQMIGDHESFAAWFDPKNRGKRQFPNWRIFWEFALSIHRVKIPLADRMRCYAGIARQMVIRRARLLDDVVRNLRTQSPRRAPVAGPVPPGDRANEDCSAG